MLKTGWIGSVYTPVPRAKEYLEAIGLVLSHLVGGTTLWQLIFQNQWMLLWWKWGSFPLLLLLMRSDCCAKGGFLNNAIKQKISQVRCPRKKRPSTNHGRKLLDFFYLSFILIMLQYYINCMERKKKRTNFFFPIAVLICFHYEIAAI